MAKQNVEPKEKYLQFGAHFSFSDLCERLKNYSSSSIYEERLKEISKENSAVKATQQIHFSRKKLKLNFNNEFLNLNPIKKTKGSLSLKPNLIDIRNTNNISIPNFKDKNKILHNNYNKYETIETDLIFPIINTELNQKSKKNNIKLSKNLDINISIQRNRENYRDLLKIAPQKSEMINTKSADKIKLNQYFKNINDNLSERRVNKLKLPKIKK